MALASRRAALLALTLAALAAPGPGRAVAGEDRAALEAELSRLAPRIEQLKREAAGGRGDGAELTQLLGQAQALAERLERAPAKAAAAPAPAPAGPDAGELREQADALRDRADKARATLAAVDRRLAELRRRAELGERLEALGAASDLFADGATTRGGLRPAVGDGGGPTGPATGTGGTPTPGGAGAVVGAPGGTSALVVPELRATLPGTTGALPANVAAIAGSEDLPALTRRRAELARSVEALRVQAEALEAEAKAAGR